MLKLFLNALEPRLQNNGKFPITIDSLHEITKLPRRFIVNNLKSDKDIKVWKRKGVYTEIEIINRLDVPNFITLDLSSKELNLVNRLYESNIKEEDLKKINYKNCSKYKMISNDFYHIKNLLELGYNHLFKNTNNKIEYKLSDDIVYDSKLERYVYKIESIINNETKENSELDVFVNKKIKCLKQSARQRNIFFDLTETDLKILYERQEGNCYFTKRKLNFNCDDVKYVISVDRLDSSKGYVNTNIVMCLNVINSMKSNLSLEDFYDIVKDIQINNS